MKQAYSFDVIDAFTDRLFGGNPAAVMITDVWLSPNLMQSIATENNLSETAFLVRTAPSSYDIWWFSPITEIAFCGHATLAAAYVLFERDPSVEQLRFRADAVGEMLIKRLANGRIQMDFPSTKPAAVENVPNELYQALSITPAEVLRNQQAYFVICESEDDVFAVQRDNDLLKQLAPYDVVVTARSESSEFDFRSRYFWPVNGGDEDPVTGSIHTGLAPLWAERLNKTELVAQQASPRGGVLYCQIEGDRVKLSGDAVRYAQGTIWV